MNLPDYLRVPRKGQCPSVLDLHLLAFDSAAEPKWDDHVEGCDDCRQEIQRLLAERRQFVAEHPPEPFLEGVPREKTGSGLLNRMRRFAGGGNTARTGWVPWLTAAGAVAAMTVVLLVQSQAEQPPFGIRFKGPSVNWTVFVSRDGRPGNAIKGKARLHPGDILSFAVQASKSGHALIVNLDDRGRFSRYFPAHAEASGEVAGNQRLQWLPSTVRLDDFIGKELITLLLSERPLPIDRVETELGDSFERAGGRLDQMSLARLSSMGADVKWVIVTKEPR